MTARRKNWVARSLGFALLIVCPTVIELLHLPEWIAILSGVLAVVFMLASGLC